MVSIIVNISVAKVRNICETIYKICLVDYKKLLFRLFYTYLQIFIYTPLTRVADSADKSWMALFAWCKPRWVFFCHFAIVSPLLLTPILNVC